MEMAVHWSRPVVEAENYPSPFLILQDWLDCCLFFEKAVQVMTFYLRHQICSVFNAFFIICNRKTLFPSFFFRFLTLIYSIKFSIWRLYIYFFISIPNGLYLSTVIFVNFNLKFNNIHIKHYTIEYYDKMWFPQNS